MYITKSHGQKICFYVCQSYSSPLTINFVPATMLGHRNSLHLWTCLFLGLLRLVSAQPPPIDKNYVVIDMPPSAKSYRVTCMQRTIPTHKSFKLDCRDLIQQHVISDPGPFGVPASTAWKETFSRSLTSVWTVSSGYCSISFSARRPVAGDTWNVIKEGIKAIAQDCVDKKGLGGKRAEVVEAGGVSRPDSLVVWITQPASNNPTYSPPAEPVHRRTCTQMRNLRGPLTARQKKIRQACCKLAIGFCAMATGGYLGPTTNGAAAGSIMAGAVVVNQGVREYRAARRPETSELSSPESPMSPVKRRRGLESWKRKVSMDENPQVWARLDGKQYS